MKKIKELEKIKHGGMKSLLKKAMSLDIKVVFFPEDLGLIKLEKGNQKVFFRSGDIPVNKRMGNMTTDKDLTKICLNEVGIMVPKGFVSDSLKKTIKMVKKMNLKYPLILKPSNGTLARGVVWDIKTEKELKKHVQQFKKFKKTYNYKNFMVEEMQLGREYRILVFNGKVLSCVEKIPASVKGDGVLSIEGLIHKFNKKRRKGFEIKIDNIVIKNLEKNKLTLKSVLPKGFILKLRNNLNMSDGGRSVECTEKMNKHFKYICEKACSVLGLSYGGVDLITNDISVSSSDYVILEINPNPFYNMHEKPLVEGKGVDVSEKIINFIFQDKK